jgi:hypothetical protein
MNPRGNTVEDQNFIMRKAVKELALLRAAVNEQDAMFSQIDFDPILHDIPFIFSTEPTFYEKSATLASIKHMDEMFVKCPKCKRELHNSVCDTVSGCYSCNR